MHGVESAIERSTKALIDAFREALTPIIPPPIAEWAAQEYRLSIEDSASPGVVVLEPWQEAILKALDDPATHTVACAASAQLGKTLAGLILAAYSARFRPGPTVYFTENDLAAKSFSRRRIAPMATANLEDIRPSSAWKRGSATDIQFTNGGSLSVLGCTPANLSSRPVRTLVATEVRGFPLAVKGEGDPLTLAKARVRAFPNHKVYLESSPGLLGSCRMWQEFEQGDARHWFTPCPHCGHYAKITYLPEPEAHFVNFTCAADAAMQCCKCGTLWTDQERIDALRKGEFRPTKKPEIAGYVSFQYSRLTSARHSLQDIVTDMQAAKTLEQRQAAMNTVLGLPFDMELDGGESIPDDRQNAVTLRYNAKAQLPEYVAFITAGVDVQRDRLECQVVGHATENNTYSLEYKVFHGNPALNGVWEELAKFLKNTAYQHPYGPMLKIAATCVDSSDQTQLVYEAVSDLWNQGIRAYAIKGKDGPGAPVRRSNHVFVWQGGERLINVRVDGFKQRVHEMLIAEGNQGRLFLPVEYTPEWFQGLTSESMVITTDKDGRPKLKFQKIKSHARNEPLDTLVYALAALSIIDRVPDFSKLLEEFRKPPKQPCAYNNIIEQLGL